MHVDAYNKTRYYNGMKSNKIHNTTITLHATSADTALM